jgi:hypothetical protein
MYLLASCLPAACCRLPARLVTRDGNQISADKIHSGPLLPLLPKFAAHPRPATASRVLQQRASADFSKGARLLPDDSGRCSQGAWRSSPAGKPRRALCTPLSHRAEATHPAGSSQEAPASLCAGAMSVFSVSISLCTRQSLSARHEPIADPFQL